MPDCEAVRIQDTDDASERLLRSRVSYGVPVDAASIQAHREAE